MGGSAGTRLARAPYMLADGLLNTRLYYRDPSIRGRDMLRMLYYIILIIEEGLVLLISYKIYYVK